MGPLRGSGVGALRQTRGPQQPDPQCERGTVKSSVDEEAAVELMWIRPDARKEREATGKAGENGTEPLGGKTQPYQKTILQRYTKEGNEARDGNEPRERVWGTRAEEAGRK